MSSYAGITRIRFKGSAPR